MIQKKKSLSVGLILACGFTMLSWDEVEAATTECTSDTDCLVGEFCILALDPPVCSPPQEAGAACKRDVVCASGHCEIPEGATAGVCAPPTPAPTPLCAGDADCSTGEFCILALDPPVCKPPQDNGAACKRDVVCASGHCEIPEGTTAGVCATATCTSDIDCTSGEFCILALDPPVCKPPQDNGAACKRDVVCTSGYCDIPDGTTAGVCAPPTPAPTPLCAGDADCSTGEFCILALDPPVCKPPQDNGAACKRDVVCTSGYCDIPEGATAGVCAPPTPLCASDADCSTGEFCILALDPPVCKPPQDNGAACKRDVVCASGHCEIPEGATAGVCAPPTPLCASDADCSTGEFCILALDPPVCRPPQDNGAACKRDVVCASGHCEIPEGTTAGVCAPPTPLCAGDADCTSGEFCILALDPPVCRPPQDNGAACKRDVVCASGHCDIPEGATAGVCAP